MTSVVNTRLYHGLMACRAGGVVGLNATCGWQGKVEYLFLVVSSLYGEGRVNRDKKSPWATCK